MQKTLIRKDAREILRHHYLMFYVLMQVLFGPILVFFLGSQMQELNNIVDMSIISLVTGFYLISWIGVGMNYIALSAITRDVYKRQVRHRDLCVLAALRRDGDRG